MVARVSRTPLTSFFDSAECCSLIFSISWDFVICICIFASYPLIRCNGQYLEIHPKATAHTLQQSPPLPLRLKRNMSGAYKSKAYSFEEFVAEFTAAFLCAHLGIKVRLCRAF